jgi:hypothetical protein
VIALAILVPQVVLVASVALRGYFPGTALLLRLGVTAIVSWCLFRGYDWARRWVPIVFFLDAVFTLGVLVARREWPAAVLIVPIEAIAIAAAIVLWRSESVDAFWRRQAAGRQAILSLGGDSSR